MDKNEVRESLKSTLTAKIEELSAFQNEGVQVLTELEDARKSEAEAGVISALSDKFDAVGAEIKARQEAIEDIQAKMGLFEDFQFEDEKEIKGSAANNKYEELFNEIKSNIGTTSAKTVGDMFADLLAYRGISRVQDVADLKADTRLYVPLDKRVANEQKEGYKSIKSLYSNHGVELDSGGAVPGFMGIQCGLVEDPNIYCLLDPPADDFEQCITMSTLNGNRLRFNREVARDDNAASVLETVYHPDYPTLLQDGTKPEGRFTIATVEVTDSKIAEFVVASDEVLEDCSFVASMIDNFLISGINAEKRRQLIAGTGLNGEMRGILNQPDVLTRTHRDIADGGAADDNIYDTFRRSLTDIWLQNGSTDNVCVILHPRDLELIDLTKDSEGRYLFNDTQCFNRMLRCLMLRTSVDMPEGTAMLGNFSNNWVFYVRKALEIRMGYTGDQFITNTNTILGEMRGLSILRCPRKVVKVLGISESGSSS